MKKEVTAVEVDPWKGFKKGAWQKEINVSDFILSNYKEYKGDDSFLCGKTQKTTKLMNKVEKLLALEAKKGLLDVDLKHLSGITSFGPGYIDKKNEVIVGLQTDKPLKRIVNLYGGVRMAKSALEAYGKHIDPELESKFNEYRKSHNQGVFDAYTPDIRKARSAGLLTGLPDAYGRGRIVGDYRRVALYGIDRIKEEKLKEFNTVMLDVSTEEGLDAFVTAYKTLHALKYELEYEKRKDNQPKFGLD